MVFPVCEGRRGGGPKAQEGQREFVREVLAPFLASSRVCYRWVSLIPSFRKPAELSVQKGGNETRGTSEDSLAREREDRRPRASLRYRSEEGSESEQGGERRPRSRRERKERGRRRFEKCSGTKISVSRTDISNRRSFLHTTTFEVPSEARWFGDGLGVSPVQVSRPRFSLEHSRAERLLADARSVASPPSPSRVGCPSRSRFQWRFGDSVRQRKESQGGSSLDEDEKRSDRQGKSAMEPPLPLPPPTLSLSRRLAPLTLARLPPTPPSRPPALTDDGEQSHRLHSEEDAEEAPGDVPQGKRAVSSASSASRLISSAKLALAHHLCSAPFLASFPPMSRFPRRPGILVLINDIDWELG